jgi:hypothetical protein
MGYRLPYPTRRFALLPFAPSVFGAPPAYAEPMGRSADRCVLRPIPIQAAAAAARVGWLWPFQSQRIWTVSNGAAM